AYNSRNKGELKTAHGVSGTSRQLTTLENHLTCACAGKQSNARPAATLKAAARGAWRRCGAEAVSVIKGGRDVRGGGCPSAQEVRSLPLDRFWCTQDYTLRATSFI